MNIKKKKTAKVVPGEYEGGVNQIEMEEEEEVPPEDAEEWALEEDVVPQEDAPPGEEVLEEEGQPPAEDVELAPELPLPEAIHQIPPLKRLKTAEVDKILQNLKSIIGESFSTNIYEEISLNSLHNEYNKTVYEILDYRVSKKKEMNYKNYIKGDYRAYFRRRLLDKLVVIKSSLHSQIKKRNLIDPNAFDKFQGWVEPKEDENLLSDRLNQTQTDFNLVK